METGQKSYSQLKQDEKEYRELKQRIVKLEKRLDRIESVPQLPESSTIEVLIRHFNKVTNSMKRIGR